MYMQIMYSRGLLDKMIHMNFLNQYDVTGVCVEIGGHTGDSGGSNTYFFEYMLGHKAFLIEPSAPSFNQLVANRPNATTLNYAVAYTDCNVELFGLNEMASTVDETRGNSSLVSAMPLRNMLAPYSLTYVDLFVVDVEGGELMILETFDWNIEVGIILVELLSFHTNKMYNSHRDKDEKVIKFLVQRGFQYEFSDNECSNLIWRNPDYVRHATNFKGTPDLNARHLKDQHYIKKRTYGFTVDDRVNAVTSTVKVSNRP